MVYFAGFTMPLLISGTETKEENLGPPNPNLSQKDQTANLVLLGKDYLSLMACATHHIWLQI